MPTIKVFDQLKKSREMHVSVLPTDTVAISQMDTDTLVRAIDLMTDNQLVRVIDLLTDDTLARAIGQMTADQRARTMGLLDSDYSQQLIGLLNIKIPVVSDLDKKMLEAVESGSFDMSTWHCGTTHCRAGWAVVFWRKRRRGIGKDFRNRICW